MPIIGLDPALLLGFYHAHLPLNVAGLRAAASAAAAQKKGATAHDAPPWLAHQPAQSVRDAQVLATKNFLDTHKVPLGPTVRADAKTEQDNQKLFALYSAVNTLAYIAKMAGRPGVPSGQLVGLDVRFQEGLKQVQAYIANTKFNNFTLQAAAQTSSVTSGAGIQFRSSTYNTRALTSGANANAPLTGVTASDSFTIAVKKGSTTTNVVINLSLVQGGLTLGNIVSYVNQQLVAAGFSTRFQKAITSGSIAVPTKATYGLQITPGGVETISLSSASATPSLYLAGSSGLAAATATAPADQQGRLIKLSNLGTTPQSVFSKSVSPTSGTSTALATQVDASGNVYIVGTATGNFGKQLNQGTQDAYLTKYDSAGNVLWTRLLGSAGSASGYGLALNPAGGVVVTGATTARLVLSAVTNGNLDTFVAKYDASGNQTWVTQLKTLASNQGNAVSVDASGNIYIGGQVSGGVIAKGQTSLGGGDAYLAKLDAKGNIVYEKQFGTIGKDLVAATATAADGSLYVASVQNGHAIVSKYANGNANVAPVWQADLGDLKNGGAIGGLTISGSQVYVSGTTQNSNLTAGGAARIAVASSGGTNAFVFNLADQGTAVTPAFVSYLGAGPTNTGGAVTVGSNGTIYLTGSTNGIFAGQSRSVANVSNAFAASLAANGSVNWIRQFGGNDGRSSGASIGIDTLGSSVLDALGLPRGTISLSQPVDLASQTTLRAGDSFQIQLAGKVGRTVTIAIDTGETLQSLATKISIQLGTKGKASVAFNKDGGSLKIAVNSGVTAKLIAGPHDFDALARLGISPGALTSASTSTSSPSVTGTTKAFGLGLGNSFDLTTTTGANLARSQLLAVLSAIQTAYQKTNTPPALPKGPGITTGTASPYLKSLIASGTLALSLLA
jgi:hypothetical protein